MNLHPHVIKATRFVLKHYDPMRAWGFPIALGWVNWHACMGFMASVLADTGKIIAVGIVRPVNDPKDGIIPYEHDENGPHLFVDFYLSKHPLGMAGLSAIFSRRFGPRQSVSFMRKEENSPRTYSYVLIHKRTIRSTSPRATEATATQST